MIPGRVWLLCLRILFGLCCLLFAALQYPLLKYSVGTPIALIDDVGEAVENPGFADLPAFFVTELSTFKAQRYRPFYELSASTAWAAFGTNMTMHHLGRWLWKIAAGLLLLLVVAAFAGRYRATASRRARLHRDEQAFPRSKQRFAGPGDIATWAALLAGGLFLFYPNNPEARLSPQETHLTFFLCLLNFGIARVCLVRGGKIQRSQHWELAILYAAAFGLAITKEISTPIILAVPFFLFFLAGRARLKAVLRLLPLLLIGVHQAIHVYFAAQGSYGTAPLSADLLARNAVTTIRVISFFDVSILLSIGVSASWAFGVFRGALVARAFLTRKPPAPSPRTHTAQRTSLFVAWLIILLALLFATACTSWMWCLRYTYPLSVVSLTLGVVAFSALHARLFEHGLGLVGPALAVFLSLWFIVFNYGHLNAQFANQYHARLAEDRLLTRLSEALREGRTILVTGDGEFEVNVRSYFGRFNLKYAVDRARAATEPGAGAIVAKKPSGPHLILSRSKLDGHRMVWSTETGLRRDRWLARTLSLSGKAQRSRPPFLVPDCGSSWIEYSWRLYEN